MKTKTPEQCYEEGRKRPTYDNRPPAIRWKPVDASGRREAGIAHAEAERKRKKARRKAFREARALMKPFILPSSILPADFNRMTRRDHQD